MVGIAVQRYIICGNFCQKKYGSIVFMGRFASMKRIAILALMALPMVGMAQTPRITEIETIDMTKRGVMPANYSGIAWMGENRFALVSDKETADGFFPLTIEFDARGHVTRLERGSLRGNVNPRRGSDVMTVRDCEGVCYVPSSGTLFISGEGDQAVLEYDTIGQPTGRKLNVPTEFSTMHIVPNYGFEALTYNHSTGLFWTTTESTLTADGSAASYAAPGVRNMLRIQSFDSALNASRQYAYRMDLPTVEHAPRQYAFGVVAMAAMDDGRLLVMEREFYVARQYLGSYVENRIYMVNPDRSTPITPETRLSSLSDFDFMAKTLLTSWRTQLNFSRRDIANYEGMCLGPRLADGSQLLLLVNDSQGGHGNGLFSLHDYLKVMKVE